MADQRPSATRRREKEAAVPDRAVRHREAGMPSIMPPANVRTTAKPRRDRRTGLEDMV